MTLRNLDVVVLNEDQPAHGLKRVILEQSSRCTRPHTVEVEFVTTSGRTQALVTLPPAAVREVGDNDLVAVRSAPSRDV